MIRFLAGIFFCLGTLSVIAQSEPIHGNMTQEAYMAMLIDSLAIAESAKDTAKIIVYSSVLATEFQNTWFLDRAASYLQIALQYAKVYSDPTYYANVCNRAGLLIRMYRSPENTHTLIPKMMDSSRYWFRAAIRKGLAIGNLDAVGWGYNGLMMNAIMEYSRNESKTLRDSIPLYYNEISELASGPDSLHLLINSATQYGFYLVSIGDFQGAKSIYEIQASRQDHMNPTDKYHFIVRLHDFLSAINHMDTLTKLRVLIEQHQNIVSASSHKQELYAKDQQYEVSKTKNILEVTASRLDVTNKALVGFTIALISFTLLAVYLFLLFRKNKKLSTRNEFLLKEQNHRVKNNLQMISSLLALQSQQLISNDAKDALTESQSRINSVALLHRMLYEGEHIGQIETISYLRSLVEEIKYSAGRRMEIELDLPEKLELKIEKVTSLGLIVNELLTNSIKHVESHIVLNVFIGLVINNGKLHLAYKDNGRGVVPEEWMSSESFGNQLIQIQSRQLKGEFEVSAVNGFRYDLRISA